MSTQPPATEWTTDQVSDLLQTSGFPPAGQVALIGSGQWSDCFAFSHGGRDLVVRVGAHGEDFAKDQLASQIAVGAAPIPQVLALGRHDTTSHGDYYAISTRVFGEPIEKILDWPQVVTPLADVLEALRSVPVDQIDGWGSWTSKGSAEATTWREFLLQVNHDAPNTRVHGWKQRLQSYPAAAAAFADGYELLQSIIVDDIPRSLVHNDLYNRNAHFSNGSITGIFDWGNSMVADHLYDLGLLCFWSPWFDHIDEVLLIDELQSRWKTDPVPNFAERLRVCMLHAGLEHIGYHAYLGNEAEATAVATRIPIVLDQPW